MWLVVYGLLSNLTAEIVSTVYLIGYEKVLFRQLVTLSVTKVLYIRVHYICQKVYNKILEHLDLYVMKSSCA